MTGDEKQFLMELFDKHELSLDTVMYLLGSAAARLSLTSSEQGIEPLGKVMDDLDNDCRRYFFYRRG